MKIDEIMKNIVASSTYKKEIGTSFQLGLPQFFLYNNELFILFYPHIERCHNAVIYYYLPRYELMLVYPFRHIASFKNLYYTMNQQHIFSEKTPVCKICMNDVVSRVDAVYELYSVANEVVGAREKNEENLQSIVSEYRERYILTTESMGLQAIYGGAYDSHSCL